MVDSDNFDAPLNASDNFTDQHRFSVYICMHAYMYMCVILSMAKSSHLKNFLSLFNNNNNNNNSRNSAVIMTTRSLQEFTWFI